MVKLNPHFLLLNESYLFAKIGDLAKKVAHMPFSKKILDLGIGDVTQPLPSTLSNALKESVDEMCSSIDKVQYGPSTGFDFLKKAIIAHEFSPSCNILIDEVFISNGSKCDIAHIQEIFHQESTVAVMDPTYPVYIDSNVLAGRSGKIVQDQYEKIVYLPCLEENNFFPSLPTTHCDLIYLCSPNNPTSFALTFEELTKWVEYAKQNNAILIFDAAYEAFITSENVPHSIYEIPGAKEVAIEIRSFSKKAGFTNLRCSYCIVPHTLCIEKVSLNTLWKRKVETTFGGVPYLIQKAAQAIYTKKGQEQIAKNISSYQMQTRVLKKGLIDLGYQVYGGIDAPYVWCKTPWNSWDFFTKLLQKCQIISIPGSGFGKSGEGFVRFSGFTPIDDIYEALNRMDEAFFCAIQ